MSLSNPDEAVWCWAFMCHRTPESGEPGFMFCCVTKPNASVSPLLITHWWGVYFSWLRAADAVESEAFRHFRCLCPGSPTASLWSRICYYLKCLSDTRLCVLHNIFLAFNKRSIFKYEMLKCTQLRPWLISFSKMVQLLILLSAITHLAHAKTLIFPICSAWNK